MNSTTETPVQTTTSMNTKPTPALPPLHVILGAGQIATLLADRLLDAGHRVRLVRRSEPGPRRPNLDWVRGDLGDLRFAEEATRGAAVVYQCSAPPYEKWLSELARVWRGGLHGAVKARARYVVLDNMYMYGRVPATSFDEDTPVNPVSRKGELRARLAEEIMAAHRAGDVRVAIGRASDFVGPGTTIAVIFHDDFYRRTLSGEPVQVIGDPDWLRSYSYSPDVAAGLATLGTRDEALGKIWHLPVLDAETTRVKIGRLQRVLGKNTAVEILSDETLAELGQQIPILHELVEMTYLFKAPFVVDDRRFRTAFNQRATRTETAMTATAQWGQRTFAT